MITLIRIESMKMKTINNKSALFSSYICAILFPLIISLFARYTDIDSMDFLSSISIFYSTNNELFLPITIGLFTLENVCAEFKNKSIKYYLMSNYDKYKIIFAKLISISYKVIIGYIISFSIYSIIMYINFKNKPMFFGYKKDGLLDIIVNILIVNSANILQIFSIISFTLMLGFLIKRKGTSILVYISLFIFINTIISMLKQGASIPQYTFMGIFPNDLLGKNISIFQYLKTITPLISNSLIFLFLALISFDKYKY